MRALRRRRYRCFGAGLVLAMGLAACGSSPEEPAIEDAGPATSEAPSSAGSATDRGEPGGSASASPSSRGSGGSSYSDWELGADPLPLRPDGLGVMRPTPPELRERRLRTTDRLAPPDDDRFHSSVGPVTSAIRDRMGSTWSPRCPVALDDLRYLTVTFVGFDGAPHTGELVVAATEAEGVVSVFAELYAAGFAIEEMRLPTTEDLEAHPTGDGNNTAALVCRPTTGASSWSAHAYGLAIDLNPFQNPYQKGDVVLPELASSYLDRSWDRAGMVQPGSVAVRAFARIGWTWGGAWRSLKDYQHFSATGR